MTTITMPSSLALVPSLETAWQDVDSSFERFCSDRRDRRNRADVVRGRPTACRRSAQPRRGPRRPPLGPDHGSASMAARLPCIARGCAASTATNFRCRPGRRRRPRIGLAAGR